MAGIGSINNTTDVYTASEADAAITAAMVAGGKPIVAWTLNGISQNSGTGFASVPEQVQIPTAAELGGTTLEAILMISANCTSAATGEFRLYNYTDSNVEGFTTSVPNGGWTKSTSSQAAITGGKAYRVQIRKVSGGGAIQIESATLILIVS